MTTDNQDPGSFPLRGENPYQSATFHPNVREKDPLGLDKLMQVGGGQMSVVNMTDVDRMIATATNARAFLAKNVQGGDAMALAFAVKHGNCCGAAFDTDPIVALEKMIAGDLEAIFGAAILVTFEIDEARVEILLRHATDVRRIIDVICAPSITEEAKALLERRNGKCKMLVNPALGLLGIGSMNQANHIRTVRGGWIEQDPHSLVINFASDEVVRTGPAIDNYGDLAFACAICKTSNSNTVTLVKDGMLIGNGVAQTKRSRAAKVAVEVAQENGHMVTGASAASDSFFPFEDGVEILIDAGVTAIFSTTGSVRDKEVQKVCEKAGVALLQLPDAQARMFFGH